MLIAAVLLAACSAPRSATADPASTAAATEQTVMLTTAAGRKVSVRVLLPQHAGRSVPLILFSHGANLGTHQYDALFQPWRDQGYAIAAPLHTDSEQHPQRDRYPLAQSLALRIEDYRLLLDAARQGRFGLALREAPVIAAGHSYGALIAMLAGGATATGMKDGQPVRRQIAGPRPAAVLALSPPGNFGDRMTDDNWATVTVPFLLVTGTADRVPPIAERWTQHLDSYHAAPLGLGRVLIYDRADHYLNGAIGRLRQGGAPRAAMLAHLARSSDAFMQAAVRQGLRGVEAWQPAPFPGLAHRGFDEGEQ
ncbi:MAG: hypothetical protein AAGI15_13140 [Pseudomonadota bacterium]